MKKALALLLLLAGAPLSLTLYFVYAPRQSQTVEEWADQPGQDDPVPLPPQPEPAPVAPVPPAMTPSPKTPRPAPAEPPAPVEPPPEAAPPQAIERSVPPAAPPVRLPVPPPADTTPMRQRAHDAEVDFQRAYAKLVAAQAKPEDKEKRTCCSTGNQ
jgi:hypothetical protein